MDEIICPICARANTTSAVNCRYCQAPLDKPEKTSSGLAESGLLKSEDNIPRPRQSAPTPKSSPAEEKPDQQDEEVPEWLKRIRELKRAEEERELEKEQWRQQTLFGQNNLEKQKHKSPTPEKKPEPVAKLERLHSERKIRATDHEKPVLPATDPPSQALVDDEDIADTENDDLPEGFVPLLPDEDKS